MALSLVTAPTKEPVRSEDIKRHLRVDVTDDDQLIDTFIGTAVEKAENFIHRKLIQQTWDLKLPGFPCVIDLPWPPVSTVTSITYLDTAGDSQTLSSTLYTTDFPAGPYAPYAHIWPAYGTVWPSTYAVPNAVTVRYVCGYGTHDDDVPLSIRTSIALLVQHYYDAGRQPVVIGAGMTVGEVPLTIADLLWPYKAFGA